MVYFSIELKLISKGQRSFIDKKMSINKYQVAIIGAGMSGLSAAVQLVESGITNIIVLEADNRVGGRIHTTQFRKLITISFNL